jgi:UrcA family protein
MHRVIKLAFVTIALAAPLAVHAQSFDQVKTVAVRSNDLDLNRSQDAQVLVRRLHAAAGQTCGPKPNAVELARARLWSACESDAFNRALATSGMARDALATAQRPPSRAVATR